MYIGGGGGGGMGLDCPSDIWGGRNSAQQVYAVHSRWS